MTTAAREKRRRTMRYFLMPPPLPVTPLVDNHPVDQVLGSSCVYPCGPGHYCGDNNLNGSSKSRFLRMRPYILRNLTRAGPSIDVVDMRTSEQARQVSISPWFSTDFY